MLAIGLFGGALIVLHLLEVVSVGYAMLGSLLLISSAYVEYKYRLALLSATSNILSVMYHAFIVEKE